MKRKKRSNRQIAAFERSAEYKAIQRMSYGFESIDRALRMFLIEAGEFPKKGREKVKKLVLDIDAATMKLDSYLASYQRGK